MKKTTSKADLALADKFLASKLAEKPVVTLPPYPSLHLARCAAQNEFPHHDHKVKRLTGDEGFAAKVKLVAYRKKLGEIRRASLELAAIELDLKRTIGFAEALEVVGEGILYWTSSEPSGKSRKAKVNWAKLCQDRKISEDELKRYQKDTSGERRFFLRRKVRTPEGIKNLSDTRTDEELDDEF